MFLAEATPFDYQDPWVNTFKERMAALIKGKRRIAYFYTQPNNSSFRYRVYNTVSVLNARTETTSISAGYFFMQDKHHFDAIATSADVLVVCRSLYSSDLNQLITKFKRKGKPVFFDVDDLVFDTSYAHLLMSTLNIDANDEQSLVDWFALTSRTGETFKLCDAAIATNSSLAEKMVEFSGLPAHIIPNFMNEEQIKISEDVFYNKKNSFFERDEKIHLGYFSGSPSHKLDFQIVESALLELLETDSRINLVLVGYIDVSKRFKAFGNRVEWQPFHDYVNLQRLIGKVEFNLMPLQVNAFTNCKSELKYFEAAIVGTNSLASPSFTYAKAISHGQNGYIVKAHEWHKSISMAIGTLDNGFYQEMAELAFEDVQQKYSWRNQIDTLLNVFGG